MSQLTIMTWHSVTAVLISCCMMTVADGQTPLAVLNGHENVVSAIEFTPDGRQLVSASWDETVRIWTLPDGKLLHTLEGHTDWVLDVSVSSDGNIISSASQRMIRRWDLATGLNRPESTELGGSNVNSLGFSPDGELLVTGGRDSKSRIWKIGQSQPTTSVSGFESWVSQVRVAPDQKTLLTGTRTGQVRLFELPSGKLLREQAAHPDRQVMILEVSPDGHEFLSSGYEQTAVLWDRETGKELAKFGGHKGVVTSAVWSPTGKWLATGERHGSVHLWDTSTNNLVRKFAAHPDKQLGFSVTALAFSPDEQWLATGSYDKSIKLWQVAED